jgi:pilus assembly protein Flp/PilA
MQGVWSRFIEDRSGATSIEYALIAAFIAMALIAGAQAISLDLVNIFTSVAGSL